MSETKSPFATPSERRIDRALDLLRLETEALNTPVHVELNLMAAFATTRARNTGLKSAKPKNENRRELFTRLLTQWFAPGFAVAASVVMASWMMLSPLSQAVDDAGAVSMPALADAGETSNPFIALQSLERIALEPSPRLIAANVPRTSLAAYGVPINPETAGQSVRTEMLVAANGQPLAMRFLP